MISRSLVGLQMPDALVVGLLGPRCRDERVVMDKPGAAIVPRHVKRAEDFIRANMATTVTLADLAQAAGVSVRALQDGFRRFRDTTPLEMLRTIRMEAAREDLVAARPGESVTSIAGRWGFAHLSRFSVSYRQRYGESPSQTLRRRAVTSLVVS